MSTPVTWWPFLAAGMAACPEPQPTSSRVALLAMFQLLRISMAPASMYLQKLAKSPSSQVAFCLALMAARSGAGVLLNTVAVSMVSPPRLTKIKPV